MKNKIIIVSRYYVPSIKGGGPIQSIKNLVGNLHNEFDFYIITSDRDLGDDTPFSNIDTNKWIYSGDAYVYYANLKKLSLFKIKEIINNVNADAIYLNSFFGFVLSIRTIILFKIRALRVNKVILAPRGQFSMGALGMKNYKKVLYIKVANFFGLYNNIEWHATNEQERSQVQQLFMKPKIYVANNLTRDYKTVAYYKNTIKNKDELKLVYVARIHPMKNLFRVIEILDEITEGTIKFSIYGPVEDISYWEKCKNKINSLKDNIEVEYFGEVSNEEVLSALSENHVFILLTLGENFGHSISESLISGCPVIISDQTPWRDLIENNAGFDLPLEDSKGIKDAIIKYQLMENSEYEKASLQSFNYAKELSRNSQLIDQYIEMFNL